VGVKINSFSWLLRC